MGVILSAKWFCPCSILPVLCPREGNSGRQRRPSTSVSPGPGADGRGQNVVPQERLGRCEICKICSEQPPDEKLFSKAPGFNETCLLCVDHVNFTCLSAFIFVQVLEAHGLRPISLKPKEVVLKGNHSVKYLSYPQITWATRCVLKFRD